MSYFKAKMHQIRFRPGFRPRPRWGSLQRSPRTPSWIWGALLLRRGEGRRGREGEGSVGGTGREEREGKDSGRKGPWAPHYLEEVYAYDNIYNYFTDIWHKWWQFSGWLTFSSRWNYSEAFQGWQIREICVVFSVFDSIGNDECLRLCKI